MRPKKTRWIKCKPRKRCFKPLCKPLSRLQRVFLSLDEFEALRLYDLVGLEQEQAARRMKISRSTLSRILSSARFKISDALVNIKAINIEGGCCRITRRIK